MKANDKRKGNGKHLTEAGKGTQFNHDTAKAAQAKGVEARWCYATMRSMLTAKLDELDADGRSRRDRITDRLLNAAEAGSLDAIELLARLVKE